MAFCKTCAGEFGPDGGCPIGQQERGPCEPVCGDCIYFEKGFGCTAHPITDTVITGESVGCESWDDGRYSRGNE